MVPVGSRPLGGYGRWNDGGMGSLAGIVEVIAILLALVGLSQPLASRLRLPHSVVLAGIGTALGSVAVFITSSDHFRHLHGLAASLTHLPINSASMLLLFLPILLFHASLMMDVRRLLEDAVPILVLAVVAVFVTTGAIGLTLAAASTQPIEVCLLVGAIVATTDPSAVVAIFRDLGAPARLTRLVEGESLLNDAAAIAIFTVLVAMIHSGGGHANLPAAVVEFLVSFLGGIAFGLVAGRVVVALMPLMNDDRAAVTTLLLAVPYLVFIVAEHRFHVSGVVSVVATGLTIGTAGRASVSPFNWTFLEEVWEQLAFWAGSLIFILASLLIPSLLLDLSRHDLWLLLLLILAATISRAAVLFGILTPLTRWRLSAPVSTPYKLVITWGGLRGAVTVALALAVREDDAINDDITRFVVVLATGFVLFTLFVNGLSLRWLIKVLKLDQLGPRDQALRDQVVALSLEQVRESIGDLVVHNNFSEKQVAAALHDYEERIARATARDVEAPAIRDRDRLAVGLIALANYERRLILEHHGHQLVSRPMIEFLLRNVDRLIDSTRSGGRIGYNRAAKRAVSYSFGFKASHWLHRRFGIEDPLARRLGYRFEALRVNVMILDELRRFNERRLTPILGQRIVDLAAAIMTIRQDRVKRLYEALQLQYPEYFEALEARFIRLSALRQEAHEYKTLHEEGLIGQEVYDNLSRAVRAERARADYRPHLDLKLKPEQLIAQIEMFKVLNGEQLTNLAKLAKPRLAIPDEVIYRRGARGDSVFFISSGAVEIRMPQVHLTLGRGAIVGQMSLLNRAPRVADVVALTYSHLLMLYESDFRKFLETQPELRAHIERINNQQMAMNASISQGVPVDTLQHGTVVGSPAAIAAAAPEGA